MFALNAVLLSLWVLSYSQEECSTKGDGDYNCEIGETCASWQDCVVEADCVDGVCEEFELDLDCAELCGYPYGNPSSGECQECCFYGGYNCPSEPGGNGTDECAEVCSNPSNIVACECCRYGCEPEGNVTEEPCYASPSYATCCSSPGSEDCTYYCYSNCGECKSKGKSNVCPTGRICEVSGDEGYCREAGNGQGGSVCGQAGDAPCQATLSCKNADSYHYQNYCGGNGTSGARCEDYNDDANCNTDSLVCDYGATAVRVCRTKGNGNDQDPCNMIGSGDAPCKAGLTCDQVSEKCRTSGGGLAGQPCGSPGDLGCTEASSICDDYNYTCRTTGSGAPDASCTSTQDVPCSSTSTGSQACDAQTGTCRDVGGGSLGAKCGGNPGAGGVGDAPCNTVPVLLVCDSGNGTCRKKGEGTEGDFCKPEDNYYCAGQLICDYSQGKCRARGDGTYGTGCTDSGESCNTGLVCSAEGKCAGTGATGAVCGGSGDVDCGAGTTCDAQTCRFTGTGAVGEKCGSAGDAACTSGTCGADNVCAAGGGKGAANSIYIPSFLIALLVAFLFL